LDALQSGIPSGVTVLQSGVGFSPTATAPITVPAVIGVVPGAIANSSGTANYTDASVTVSGAQFAQMLFALYRNASSLRDSIDEVFEHHSGRSWLPGSIDAIRNEILQTTNKIEVDIQPVQHYFGLGIPVSSTDLPALKAAANFPAFDEDMTELQSLSTQLTTLSGSLAARGFGNRAAILQNNYAILAGVWDFIDLGRKQNNCRPPAPQTLTIEQIKLLKPDDVKRWEVEDIAQMTQQQVQAVGHEQVPAQSSHWRPGLWLKGLQPAELRKAA